MALPVSPDPTDRRAAVVRLLTASPDGLSDAALARALGGPEAGVRPQTVNHLCRRMVADGELERVGTRPILNRLPARARRRRRTKGAAVEAVPSPPAPEADVGAPGAADPVPAEPASAAPDSVTSVPEAPEPTSPSPRSTLRFPKHPPKAIANAPRRQEGSTCGPPPYDALQAWSRVVNVQALVATWLVRQGATLRWAAVDGDGPARDLVASMDGDDVHVEVTGWPADGARTHPTTIAGDWFSAAEQAAAARRRAHPRARIVIALPDTRRYRSLTEQRSASLAGARAEVWFVDPAGAVHAR
ncbi:MAG TPA: hypothetical protein VK935_22075 [Actinomycetospora sp.]|nr:hypothetical protein [Actinomycetospora sp.]